MFNLSHLTIKYGKFKQIVAFLTTACLILLTHLPVTAAQPSTIRIAQLMATSEKLDVSWRSLDKSNTFLQFKNLSFKQITNYQILPPGRYRLEVKQQEKTIFEAIYGLGVEDDYTLVLVGIEPSKPISENQLWSNLQWIFGGAEATAINGYLPQARLLLDNVDRKSDTAQIRVMHAASGIVPLSVNFQGEKKIDLANKKKYPQVSQFTKLQPKSGKLILLISDSPLELIRQPINLKANALTTVFIAGGLSERNSLEILVAENIK